MFKPGQSGNPGGRRPGGYKDFIAKLRGMEEDAIATIADALAQRPVGQVGVAAAVVVFDRTRGKPIQMVHVDGELEIKVSERMRVARDRVRRMVLEGVAEAVVEADERETLRLTP